MASIIQDNQGFRIESEDERLVYLKDTDGYITLDRFPWIDQFLAVNSFESNYEVLYRFTNGEFAKWIVDGSGLRIGFQNFKGTPVANIAAEFHLDEIKLLTDINKKKQNTNNSYLKKKPVQIVNKRIEITNKIFENVDTKVPHRSGSLSRKVLEAIESLMPNKLGFSVETGCGRSTILLSQRSQKHLVFCLDDRKESKSSVDFVRNSPLFTKEAVEFIFGCTQQTLATHKFSQPIDLAIIDGPHGYPFPDLEYFFIYPNLREGALLVIDDIHIPSIGNMFDILAEDEMFDFLGIVLSTGFLRRTSSATQNPYGDGWQYQNYNARKIIERSHHFFQSTGDIPKVDLPLSIDLTLASTNSADFTCIGWSMPDELGSLTLGSSATLLLDLNLDVEENFDHVDISVNLSGLLHPNHRKQAASFVVNGVRISHLTFEKEEFIDWVFKCSKEVLLKSSPIEFRFDIDYPFAKGKDEDWRKNDWRKLGLIVNSIDLQAI